MRPMMDMVASLVLHNLFGNIPEREHHQRFQRVGMDPGSYASRRFLRPEFPSLGSGAISLVAGRETGSETVGSYLRSRLCGSVVWDLMVEVCEYVNPANIVMATDYPHPDGFADAREYNVLMQEISAEDKKKIMRNNLRGLIMGGS